MAEESNTELAPQEAKYRRLPLIVRTGDRYSGSSGDQRLINFYMEIGVGNKLNVVKRTGITTETTIASSGTNVRGCYWWESNIYYVIDNTLYKYNPDTAVYATIGTLQTSSGRLHFTETGQTSQYLFITDGAHCYTVSTADAFRICTEATKALTGQSWAGGYTTYTVGSAHGYAAGQKVLIEGSTPSGYNGYYTIYDVPLATTFRVAMSDPGASTVLGTCAREPTAFSELTISAEYMDGYVFVMTTSGLIYNCDLETPTTGWNTLNFLEAEMSPDDGIGIKRHSNFIVAFNKYSTEFFYNAANTSGSPLSRQAAYYIQLGCADIHSAANSDGNLTWVSQSREGGRSVITLDGVKPTVVSSKEVERIVDISDLTEGVYSYVIKINGHIFYVLTLIYSNRTMVYDFVDKEWAEWSNGTDYFTATFFTLGGTTRYLMSKDNKKLYYMSTTNYEDDGTAITSTIITDKYDAGTNNLKRNAYLNIICDKTNANLSVSYTDDDYNTYSTARTLSMNVLRTRLSRMGSFRRRAWKFIHSSNSPCRISHIDLYVDIGDS